MLERIPGLRSGSELRAAVRSLARSPGFSLLVIVTLAVGIGANTALASYLVELLRPRVDAPQPEDLAFVYSRQSGSAWGLISYPDFVDYRQGADDELQMVGWDIVGRPVQLPDDRSAFAWGHGVSLGYFEVLGVQPELGRFFTAEDQARGAAPVAVLGPRAWRSWFGDDPEALGRPLVLGDHRFTIVGVAPEGFAGLGLPADLYLPLAQRARYIPGRDLEDRQPRTVTTLIRCRPGIGMERAGATLATLAARLEEAYPQPQDPRDLRLQPVNRSDTGDASSVPYLNAARALTVGVLVLLLLACANVANLLLARATARRRELGVLAALGADRRQLVGRSLLEVLLLALPAGLLSLLLAGWGLEMIERYVGVVPVGFGQWSEGYDWLHLDRRAYLATAVLTLLTAAACGLAPALSAARRSPSEALRAAAGAPAPGRLRRFLVIAQVALSALLLIAAGLLGRSLASAFAIDPGFSSERLLLVSFALDRAPEEERFDPALLEEVQQTAMALPGVEAASLTTTVPLWGIRLTELLHGGEDRPRKVGFNVVGPGYFETLRIPLLAGRTLTFEDRPATGGDRPAEATEIRTGTGTGTGAVAVVVNRSLAEELWPGESPLGRPLSLPEAPGGAGRVVGMVEDSRQYSLTEPPRPMLYASYLEWAVSRRLTALLRTAGPPRTVAPAARRAFERLPRGVAVIELAPFASQLERSLHSERLNAHLATLLGLLGLGLAATGLAGLMGYSVAARRREIGIRLAVGATPTRVRRLVLREALGLAAIGLAIGLAAALPLARLLASLLFDITPLDPWSFAGAALLLAAVAAAAAYLPAARAARVDPLVTLKSE